MSRILRIEQHWPDYTTHLLADCTDSEIKGSVCVSNYPEDKETWIHSLYVDKAWRRKGVATRLLDEAFYYTTYRPPKVCVDQNAPQWLMEYYKSRGYQIIDNTKEK